MWLLSIEIVIGEVTVSYVHATEIHMFLFRSNISVTAAVYKIFAGGMINNTGIQVCNSVQLQNASSFYYSGLVAVKATKSAKMLCNQNVHACCKLMNPRMHFFS